MAALKLQKKGIYIVGQTVDYVYTHKQDNRMNVEPIIDNVIPPILPSGLAHYWNKRIYGWLSSIMSVLTDIDEFNLIIGEINCVGEVFLPSRTNLDEWIPQKTKSKKMDL